MMIEDDSPPKSISKLATSCRVAGQRHRTCAITMTSQPNLMLTHDHEFIDLQELPHCPDFHSCFPVLLSFSIRKLLSICRCLCLYNVGGAHATESLAPSSPSSFNQQGCSCCTSCELSLDSRIGSLAC